MKQGLLITHELKDDFTPVVVIDVDASDKEVTMAKWDHTPEEYELVHDVDMIEIVYKDGTVDPIIFRTTEVDMA